MFKVINKDPVHRNTITNQKTDWIGLVEIITIIVANNINNEKIINNWFIVNLNLQGEVPFPPLCYDLLYF